MKLMFHADDFGYNIEVSKDIIECAKEGTLDGISIMPNSPYFEECMEMLEKEKINLSYSIHFSISEGPCLSDKDSLYLLVNDKGMFKLSFFKLLLMSVGPKRKELEKELNMELRAQYLKALPYLNEINIDSHVHYHMIPLVLNSMLKIVKESGRAIGYLRIPSEPIKPFLKHKELISTYSMVNLIKNLVLNFLYLCDKKILKKYEYETAVFWGILLSGHMDIERVSVLLKDFISYAEKKGMNLEILGHPGKASSAETVLDPYNTEYSKAPLSEDRHIEKNMFMEIHNYL